MTSVNDIKGGYWLEKQEKEFPVDRIKQLSDYNMLFFGFVSLHPTEFTIDITSRQKILLQSFVQGCQANTHGNIKAILSVGALAASADDPDVTAASRMLSEMARSKRSRDKFVDSAVAAAEEYGLDGIDLAWGFPTVTAADMLNLADLLGELRQAVERSGTSPPLLSAAVYYKPDIIVGGGELRYHVEAINNYLDFVNVVCYDYCDGAKCLVTCADSRLHDNIPSRGVSTADGISAWIQGGVNEGKLVLGIPMHGKKWELTNHRKRDIGSPANYKGVMAYKDVVDFNVKQRAKHMYNAQSVVEYSFSNDTWITYDASKTIPVKIKFAKDKDLAGFFLFSLASDHNYDISAIASKAWEHN